MNERSFPPPPQDLITRNRESFTEKFAPGGGIYRGSDRTGLALGCLVMFRDLRPDNWEKLTEVVLKNNIQCDLYSKARWVGQSGGAQKCQTASVPAKATEMFA